MDIGTITCWDDIVGNYRIKQHFENMIRELKVRKSPIQRQNVLILGDSRGGKTSVVEWLIRCLHCREICPETLNPVCGGKCDRCKIVDPRFGDAGISPLFLQLFLSSDLGQKLIDQAQSGSGREGLNFQSIRKFPLPLPSPPEQTKIANFLTALDRKIESVGQQIELTQTFKRGLLQQMFV